jgi:Mn2+/Fe2+ NRAMP family transporter
MALDFARISPVKALFYTAVINGLLAPFLLVGVLLIATDRKIMRNQPSSLLRVICVCLATLLMFGAAIGIFVF